MKISRVCHLLTVTLSVIALLNCGGGGGATSGGGTQPPPPPPPPAFAITTTSIPPGQVGVPISFQLKAANGADPLYWMVYPWMPSGLKLSMDGLITGTPQYAQCGSALDIRVNDSSTPVKNASAMVTYNVAQMYNGLRQGQVGEYYGWGFQFSCAKEPVAWSLVSGNLPPGLEMMPFSPGNMQLDFRGMPAQPGTWDVTVEARDAIGRVGRASGTINILPPKLEIASDDFIRPGVLNQAFQFPVLAIGGTPPYHFSISYGALPAGVALDPNSGAISGTPTIAGFSEFTVRVDDGTKPNAFRAEKRYTMLVTSAPLPPRNNTSADATEIFPGHYDASLSPYADADGNAAPDHDYYVLTANAGEVYQVAVSGMSSAGTYSAVTDPALEIVDRTGTPLMTCNDPLADNPPADAPFPKGAGNFTDACMNYHTDWTDASRLDIKVPEGATEFFIHVFDFMGRARPDATYTLYVGKKAVY